MATIESAPASGTGWRVFTEDWDPACGTPATFELDGPDDVEQAEADRADVIVAPPAPATPLCFIDGSRRVELSLWSEHAASGERVPGLVGAYAVGAVTARPGGQAAFEGVRVGRAAIWGGGHTGTLTSPLGHRWVSDSIASVEPADLLMRLQDRMRLAEGVLAMDAAAKGWTVVLDGPLNRTPWDDALVTGYIKTHRRQLLPPPAHAAVPRLPVAARTPLYRIGGNRYTCYFRVGEPGPGGSPWSGIARLDFPSTAGLEASVARADLLTARLPAYAGVAHRDPRAPVNLTPVKNLERHLGARMGPVRHATRAARDAVMAGRMEP